MKIPWEQIEELTNYMKEKGLSELTVETKDEKVTIKRDAYGEFIPQVLPQILPSVNKPLKKDKLQETSSSRFYEVASPMVGTFYVASNLGAEPFVQIGSKVKQGDVLCIIEAMKIMNELPTEVSGKVVEILVKDNQTVEFGQVLMRIEPD